MIDWAAIGSIVSALGLALTGIGLCFAAFELRQSKQIAEESKRVSQGEFLLHLEELFQTHTEIHKRLRPGGDWSDGDKGPATPSEWADLERYMGLFERINALVNLHILDIGYVDDFYGYRLLNIVRNPVIFQAKLAKGDSSWKGFLELVTKIQARRSK
jgi:hypothetical protein